MIPRQCDIKAGMPIACLHWPRVMWSVNGWGWFKWIGRVKTLYWWVGFGDPLMSPDPGYSLSDDSFWTPSIHGDTIFFSPLLGLGLCEHETKNKQWNPILSATDLNSVLWKECSYYFICSGTNMREERTSGKNEGGLEVKTAKTKKKQKRGYWLLHLVLISEFWA